MKEKKKKREKELCRSNYQYTHTAVKGTKGEGGGHGKRRKGGDIRSSEERPASPESDGEGSGSFVSGRPGRPSIKRKTISPVRDGQAIAEKGNGL